MSAARQPRQPAGTPQGGRFAAFATPACPTTYRLLTALSPARPDRRPAGWGSPAAPIIKAMPKTSVPLAAVSICCPGCVYGAPAAEAQE